MKPLALFLLAVLLFSFIPLVSMQAAQALSAIVFTNETTITSQHEQFQQVYENGTSSTVYLDANSTGSYFMDSWDGTTLTSLDSTLTNTTYTVDAFAEISPVDLSRYSLLFDGSTEYAQASANTIYDVTTQDFWMAGMFKRTSDSGGNERLVQKRSEATGNSPGYVVYVRDTDVLAARFSNGVGSSGTLSTTATVSLNVWYAWGFSADRNGDLSLYLYNLDTGASEEVSADISTLTASATNTQTFTVARRSDAANQFFPGPMDNLIPPQIGQTLSEAQFTEFATTGAIDGVSFTSWYDMNDGMGTTLNDEAGSNDLTLFNTPTWSSDVTAASTSRPTIYVTGRDSGDGVNGYGKWNLADLSEVSDSYQSSALAPLDIAQSTSNLYSAAIGATAYGTLYDVSITRAFGSYAETSIHTGDVTTPAYIFGMDQATGSTTDTLCSSGCSGTAIAELAATSSVLIGDRLGGVMLSLSKTNSPTGTATIGTIDSSGNMVQTCASLDVSTLTASQAAYYFLCQNSVTLALNDRVGIKFTGGDSTNSITAYYSTTDPFNGSASRAQTYSGSWANTDGSATRDLNQKIFSYHAETVVYDGSPDTRYHFWDANGDIRVVKRTGSTTLIATAMDHTAGEPFSVVQLTDRIIIQTATDTYQLLTSTDAITQLHSNSFNTRYAQTFDISPAERDFNTNTVYVANSTYAENWTPSDGTQAQVSVFIDDVDAVTSSIDPYDPTKYYYLSENDLTVEATSASDTSWEVDDVGARVELEITPYSERLTVPLQENRTLFTENVFRLVCDANYELDTMTFEMFAVGSDADCQMWRVLAESDDTVGRERMPYARAVDLVHASPYTTYGFELETTNPIIYTLQSEYEEKTVDSGDFDSGGQAQQRYLFGQCYDITVTDVNTGEVALAGTACANDFTTKTISLTGITIPDPLVHPSWNYQVDRDTANPANNIISGNVSSTTTPFNATIYVADHFIGAYKTFEQTLNYTNVNMANFTINGITENQTLYFSVFDGDGDPALNFQSQGNFLNLDMSFLDVFGEFFGIPLMGLFVIIFAGIFTKSNAYFGVFATAAVVGVMSVIGLLDIASNMWTLVLIIAALGMFGARRFL